MLRGIRALFGLSGTVTAVGPSGVPKLSVDNESKRATKRKSVAMNLKQERRRLSRECTLREEVVKDGSNACPINVSAPDHNIQAFATSKELAAWLNSNHTIESELWVRIFKKDTKVPSVTWDDVVVECLCWGWIDGIRKSAGDQSYIQRITPRKARSNWSKRNRCHVERLIKEGRMEESGLRHVHAAKEDGRWESAYSVSELEVPPDFVAAVKSVPKAHKFFNTLNKSSRCVIAYGLQSAKKPETRERRFAKFMEMLEEEKVATFFS